MRVAFIAHFPRRMYQPGFQDDQHNAPWVVLLADALLAEGVEMHVVTFGDHTLDRWARHEVERPAGRLTVWPIARRLHGKILTMGARERGLIRACLAQIGPDLVHGHGAEDIFAQCAVESGFPNVVTMQASVAWLARVRRTDPAMWFYALQEARMLRRAKRIICKTQFSKRVIGVRRGRIVDVIPNVIHPAFAGATQPPEKRGVEAVFVGTIRPEKGVHDLVEAVARCPAGAVKVKLCGCGTPKHEQALREHIERTGLKDAFEWLGHLPSEEVARHVGAARILALPTHCDNSPNVVLEAVLSGTPVIATRIGGVPEMVREGVNGRLFEKGDVGELARLLALPERELVSADYAERMRIAEAIRGAQSPRAIATRHLAVYQDVLGARA